MRHGMIALVGAVMLSGSGTSFAATLADRALDFEGSFTSLPHASQLHLMPRGGEGKAPAVQMDDSTRAILAVVLGLFVGFGSGHFVMGDGAAWLFLALDLGVIAGAVAMWIVAYATIVSGGIPVFIVAVPVLVLVALGVRIWEFVDILFKSGIASGPPPQESDVIVPRSGNLARGAFEPAMANGLNLRF